jgi:hypothetical protein
MSAPLIDWWRRRRWTRPRINRTRFYASRTDVPAEVWRHELAVVGTVEHPKWAVLECPCGRGHQLTVNLSPERKPFWRLSADKRGPSLAPSLDAVSPHRCHFWLRRGHVEWARDTR